MDKFISEDKMNINLPVPFGSTVYAYQTDCCDICCFQKELFNKILRKDNSETCGVLPCHTRIHSILSKTFDFESMSIILKYWGDRYFETEAEAKKAGEILIAANRKTLIDLGFKLGDNGYSAITE